MVKNKNILIIGGNKGIVFISKYLINKCKYNTVITSSTKINKKIFYEKYKQFKIDLTKLNNLNNFIIF